MKSKIIELIVNFLKQLLALFTDKDSTATTPTPNSVQTPPSTTTTTTSTNISPTPTVSLYVNPDAQVNQYVAQYPKLKVIADQPQGIWLGEWSGDVWSYVRNIVTKANGKTPIFVLYNIPGRDNGNYSAGGAGSPQAYYDWVGKVADAIGNAPALCILEPDAVGLSKDYSQDDKNKRYDLLSGAIDALKAKPNTKVFLDASMWVVPDTIYPMMKQAGLDKTDGFSINVSGFESNQSCTSYGDYLSGRSGKRYVIDTSRNGNGPWNNPNNEQDPWCNPPGRKLGYNPVIKNLDELYACLWIKAPGESDGELRSGKPAGTFLVDYALGLIGE